MTTNIQSLDQFAYENELQVVNTNEGKALIGFESWEQAEQIATKLGQEIIHISRRDGHHQWQLKGWMYEPFDMINDVHWADDYSIYTSAEQVAELIAELEEYGEDEERIEELKELHAELESMPEDDIAIVLDNRVTEYCHYTQMNYHYDVYRHEIAVKAWGWDTVAETIKDNEEAVAVEFYSCNDNRVHIHTDHINGIDDNVVCEAEVVLESKLMDEEDYNTSIYCNCGMVADFEEEYGDKNAKVLVIIVKQR